MRKFIHRLLWTRWKVIRTIWPYPDGYGTYRSHRFNGKRTIMDTGLSKEQAQMEAELLNKSY